MIFYSLDLVSKLSIFINLLVSNVHHLRAIELLALFLQMGPVEGVIFADYGTDLGSGSTVSGIYLFSSASHHML